MLRLYGRRRNGDALDTNVCVTVRVRQGFAAFEHCLDFELDDFAGIAKGIFDIVTVRVSVSDMPECGR
jgi:hypothetical protein